MFVMMMTMVVRTEMVKTKAPTHLLQSMLRQNTAPSSPMRWQNRHDAHNPPSWCTHTLQSLYPRYNSKNSLLPLPQTLSHHPHQPPLTKARQQTHHPTSLYPANTLFIYLAPHLGWIWTRVKNNKQHHHNNHKHNTKVAWFRLKTQASAPP